jgi:hypothetical protein
MLIFSTDKTLQILNEHRNWLCDGTFDAVPLIFIQLFTVHVIKKCKNLPLIYALFTNKQEVTYRKFFSFISNKVKNSPLSVSSDFEIAIINSIEAVFPDAEVCGCFFHLKKNICRHIQDSGLVTEYCDLSIEDNQVRKFAKMLACLAFAPVSDVVDAFVSLQNEIPSKLKKVYTYFEDNYIVA